MKEKIVVFKISPKGSLKKKINFFGVESKTEEVSKIAKSNSSRVFEGFNIIDKKFENLCSET